MSLGIQRPTTNVSAARASTPLEPSATLACWLNPRRASPFDRLVVFSSRNELLLICACMLLSFCRRRILVSLLARRRYGFLRGLQRVPAQHAAAAGIFRSSRLSIDLALELLVARAARVGLVHVDEFSAVPPLSDAAGFADAWTQATRAGRVLSLIYAMGFVVAFSYLLRALVRDWRVAVLGGFTLAFSGGMAMQMRMLRTELLSAGLFMIALLMLMVAATRGPRAWRPLVVGCGSLLITLALLNKVQVLFLIGALPVLLIFIGPNRGAVAKAEPARTFWNVQSRAWPTFAIERR